MYMFRVRQYKKDNKNGKNNLFSRLFYFVVVLLLFGIFGSRNKRKQQSVFQLLCHPGTEKLESSLHYCNWVTLLVSLSDWQNLDIYTHWPGQKLLGCLVEVSIEIFACRLPFTPLTNLWEIDKVKFLQLHLLHIRHSCTLPVDEVFASICLLS